MSSIIHTNGVKPLVAAVTAVLLTPDTAFAKENEQVIEEVVVTAQKRAQSLQQVPIAVTALSADLIEKAKIDSLDDIATRTPSFTIGQQSPTAPELTIRGIGSTDREAGSDRSVVLFVDEVYIGRSGGSTFDLFDLERVEILRGPQGTLFGRNVVGGAINLVSAKPKAETEGKFQISAGSFDTKEIKGVYNTALSDTVYGRVSASIKDRGEGYFNNIQLGVNDIESTESYSLRGQLLFNLSENTRVLLAAEYADDEQTGIASKVTQGAATDADFAAGLGPFNFTPDPDPYNVSNNILGAFDRSIFGFSGRVEWDKDWGSIVYLGAYRSSEFDLQRDIAGIGISNPNTPLQRGFESSALNNEDYSTFSHELRFSSDLDENWNWIAGIYYLDEDIQRDQIRDRKANTAFSRPLFAQAVDTTSFAVFGELNFQLSDTFDITVGSRYTKDDKDFSLAVSNTLSTAEQAAILAAVGRAPSLNPASAEFSSSLGDEWSQTTSKVTFAWAVSDDVSLYATVSEGFKSGGFQGLGATPEIAMQTFEPETALNKELGAKTQFWSNRAQVNLSYFQMDFEDLQLRDRVLLIPNDPHLCHCVNHQCGRSGNRRL